MQFYQLDKTIDKQFSRNYYYFTGYYRSGAYYELFLDEYTDLCKPCVVTNFVYPVLFLINYALRM